MKHMTRATIDGIELEYEVREWESRSCWCMRERWLSGSSPFCRSRTSPGVIRWSATIASAMWAAVMWPVRSASGSRRLDSRALMRSFGIERAHLVGHSSGGTSAMQLALDAPDAVQ